MDKVYPIAILIAAMTTTVSGNASERVPRLPSSTYNVEIRPDNYYYHEQQLGAWFIQCYQRKQPSERYWHCNASDSETIRRFRTTLKDPALAFTDQESQPVTQANTAPAKQSTLAQQPIVQAETVPGAKNPIVQKIPHKKHESAQQLAYMQTNEHQKKELAGKTHETKKSQTPIAQETIAQTRIVQTTAPQTVKNPPIQSQETQHHWVIQNTDFNNPALEPETYYLLQLAAFQNKQDASQWQQRYPDIKTQVIKSQGKFTQWFNVVTAQPVEYIEAIALSETIKDQTGETPWIREKKELL
ncbi:hypothetical protein [uncultured Amphritea sp.]|uniref:hypothetical protein n=1 Tax=uncultured Amphritea sp. TaxID=981605 RepID=UPI00260692F9|nr:hypothetical protein [uncultured Amphritea sp.]